jgi:hypothetical protein
MFNYLFLRNYRQKQLSDDMPRTGTATVTEVENLDQLHGIKKEIIIVRVFTFFFTIHY